MEPSDADLQARTPSATTGRPRSRSVRGPEKKKNKTPSNAKSQHTGASSSRHAPAERARSFILTTTEPTANEMPRERASDSKREMMDPERHIPSTIDYPEHRDIYVLQDDESGPFLDETCKLASNTASFHS